MYRDYNEDTYENHRRILEDLTLDELKVLNDFHYIRLEVITSLIEEKHQELGAIGKLADEDYIYLQGPLRYSRSPVRARSRSPRASSVSISPSRYPGGYSIFRSSSRSRGPRSGSPIRSRSASEASRSYSESPIRSRAESPAARSYSGSPIELRSEPRFLLPLPKKI